MSSPSTTDALPPIAHFEAISDPIERAAALTRLAATVGHRFPRSHAALRRDALRHARELPREDGEAHTFADLGSKIGLHSTRVWQILRAGVEVLCKDRCAPPVVLPTTRARNRKTAAGGDAQSVPAGSS